MGSHDSVTHQHPVRVARKLDLKTALPDTTLIDERFNGRKAVSESFRFNINCVSTSAYFDLGAPLGDKITQHLLHADGSKDPWHGYVTQAILFGPMADWHVSGGSRPTMGTTIWDTVRRRCWVTPRRKQAVSAIR